MLKKITLLLVVLFVTAIMAQEAAIVGKWKTVDEEGKAKSVVEIYKKENGKFYGKIIKIFNKDRADAICTEADEDDPRYNQKILGMEIITNLKQDGNEFSDGEIFDPQKGKEYDCKLWVENGRLQVRGYVMFFHRTQEWLPYNEE